MHVCGATGLGCRCPFGSHVHECNRHLSGDHGGRGGMTAGHLGWGGCWAPGAFPQGSTSALSARGACNASSCLPTGKSFLPHASTITPHLLDEQSPASVSHTGSRPAVATGSCPGPAFFLGFHGHVQLPSVCRPPHIRPGLTRVAMGCCVCTGERSWWASCQQSSSLRRELMAGGEPRTTGPQETL